MIAAAIAIRTVEDRPHDGRCAQRRDAGEAADEATAPSASGMGADGAHRHNDFRKPRTDAPARRAASGADGAPAREPRER